MRGILTAVFNRFIDPAGGGAVQPRYTRSPRDMRRTSSIQTVGHVASSVDLLLLLCTLAQALLPRRVGEIAHAFHSWTTELARTNSDVSYARVHRSNMHSCIVSDVWSAWHLYYLWSHRLWARSLPHRAAAPPPSRAFDSSPKRISVRTR